MNLDNTEEFKKYDPNGVLDTVRLLADQLQHGWDEVNRIELKPELASANNIVLSGMGGSALGGRVVEHLYKNGLRAPLIINTDYSLPNYVNEKSLVILSSYSGNTEEVLYAANHAFKVNAKIIGICVGGDLEKFLDDNKLTKLKINPKYNPSGQPRLALGYSVIGILGILNKLAYISVSEEEINEAIKSTRKFLLDYGPNVIEADNLAKRLAREFYNFYPIIIASEHLIGAAHCFKNQLNESSKTFASLYDLPELNHHLMESLVHPAELKPMMKFLFLESEKYFDRVLRRYKITKDVVSENGITSTSYFLRSETRLEQAFEVLAFGGFVQFYLAMLYKQNPSEIPWVDYFKTKLNEV